MVDYALRRRFAFITLQPAFASEAFQDYLIKADVSEEMVGKITRRLAHLNEQIRADSKNLGPGFEIGHSYFVPSGDEESLEEDWYRGIIRTQVEPLLREYWFDKSAQVDGYVAELLG
jgi:5-methylcytosine-specific restriction protein B